MSSTMGALTPSLPVQPLIILPEREGSGWASDRFNKRK